MNEPSRYEGLNWDQIDRLEREEETALDPLEVEQLDFDREEWDRLSDEP